jgi:hypothetical protein
MSQAPLSFESPAHESLALLELPMPVAGTKQLDPARVRARCFEFSCRGDRARLELFAPGSPGPFPTLLAQPCPPGSSTLASLPGLQTWLSAGLAVASLTLPLFGARRSPKLTAKLEKAAGRAFDGEPMDDTDGILLSEFTRQSVLELRRVLDVLDRVWDARVAPIAYAGAGLGALVGAIFCAVDERPAAAALTPVSSESWLAEIAPRPVHTLEDEPDLLDAAWPLLSPVLTAPS